MSVDPSIVFMGTPEFAAEILQKLHDGGFCIAGCVCQPDKPSGRKMKCQPPPAKILAEKLGIPVLQPEKARDPSFIAQLRDWNPDLVITAAYGKILPQMILDIPRHGCLNVHGSLLPKYRGSAPVQRVVMQGEKMTGVTIMKMDAGMDTGDILTIHESEIPSGMNADVLMMRLAAVGGELLLETIHPYLKGKITPQVQDSSEATYAPPLKKEEGLIQWERSAVEIHNLVRGLYGWPGTYTFLNGNRMKIFETVVFEDKEEIISSYIRTQGTPRPGTILSSSGGKLLVFCGKETVLQLLSIQSPSGKRVAAKECAHNYPVGTLFTPK